jgi:hypothetical protein
MKMPSTYVSLLLLCGFTFIYIFTQKHSGSSTYPAPHAPFIKEKRPVVKRFSPAKSAVVSLDKKYGGENKAEQTPEQENEFLFLKDVIANIAPAMKHFK